MVSAELAISIGSMIGATLRPQPGERVHGGSINECYRWETDGGSIFVKVAPERQGAQLIDRLLAAAGR